MTKEQLQEIRERSDAATPGPLAWQRFGELYFLTGQYGMRPIILGIYRNQIACLKNGLLYPLNPRHPDAEFLAHARTDVPALLTHIDTLQSENAALKEQHDQEIGRWQKAIYELLCKATGADIDGAGSDSGDPLDFTLSEIKQGLNHAINERDALKEQLRVAETKLEDARYRFSLLRNASGNALAALEQKES